MTAIGIVLLIILVGIPWVNGVLDIVMATRFGKNNGVDKTAVYLNWNAFKWGWLHNADRIVEAFPAFGKDLSETFGIRPDDGRVT